MCLAIPGKVVSIESDDSLSRTGKVSFGGVLKEINLTLVPEAGIGNYVLVHAGFAISTVNEEEANQTFEYLRQIEELGNSGDNDS
ncbi:MAG: HypC/HybG/HupF family hydrogenase formation chaperone [candidate division Zixibacteria bacterium HGW-Zixibacteria-1]|nr:MAG: HypC/HybG/HupF family hydrogenase formation chaperone [candidate division Zixibacteria bacterium HGW-Zixibacteria-1]